MFTKIVCFYEILLLNSMEVFSYVKLPNINKLVVEREKIIDYLLNASHPDNGGKAAFFLSLGFNRNEWLVLARAFQDIALSAEITKSVESKHGRKYIIDGRIKSPSGRSALVRTVWIVNRGFDSTRRVTAYPINE